MEKGDLIISHRHSARLRTIPSNSLFLITYRILVLINLKERNMLIFIEIMVSLKIVMLTGYPVI